MKEMPEKIRALFNTRDVETIKLAIILSEYTIKEFLDEFSDINGNIYAWLDYVKEEVYIDIRWGLRAFTIPCSLFKPSNP